MSPGRTIVVTGASSGIGRATARAFGDRGDRVALLARSAEGLAAAEREIQEGGGAALPITTDVSDFEQVNAAATRVENELGPIDVWVNDAMATIFAPFEEVEPEEFERATKVTYLGAVWGTKAALSRMLPRDHGTIVQVGSALGYRGIPLQSAYCGAKHAVQGFTESVRTELLHEDSSVALTMVQLPGLNTPQFATQRSKMPRHPQPVPPIFQPEVAADAIVWASENPRREVFVGGATLKTIWGNKVAPWFADRYLARTAYGSQQTEEETGPRAGNLFETVDGDRGAHGPFDDRAKSRSIHLWLTKHRGALAAGLAGAAALAVGAAASQRH